MPTFDQYLGDWTFCQSGIGKLARITDISNESNTDLPAELREIEQRLRDARPALTGHELDEIKQRTKGSAARGSNKALAKKKGSSMKPRLALIAVLALGILMGGTTAAFAASSSAGSAQYAPEEEERHFCTEEGGSGGGGNSGGESGCEHEHVCDESSSGSAGSGSSGSGEENCERQEIAPQESEGTTPSGSLPFTGFPVAPALLVGIGLLGAGMAMRQRLRSGGGLA